MITAKAFAGKKYAVYGLARSGIATVTSLLGSGADVAAWDGKAEARLRAPAGTSIVNLDEADLSQFDGLVVTPGLPLNRHPIAQRARDAGVEIIGDIELFAHARPELPPHKVVGITGTNGKSTTTALIHHILKTAGVPTTMGGNIGLPILAQDPLPEGGVYVLELSSYQIDLTQTLDCDVAVLLNITPDHLDRYESFEAYAASKFRLFRDAVVRSLGGDPCGPPADRVRAQVYPATTATWATKGASFTRGRINLQPKQHYVYLDGEPINSPQEATLQGPHNAENAVAAAAMLNGLEQPVDLSRCWKRPPRPIPACRTAWSAFASATACSSSMTARRPTRPLPRQRSRRSIASAGSAAGRRRPKISMNAHRTSATSAPPTRSARRANISRASCRRTCL